MLKSKYFGMDQFLRLKTGVKELVEDGVHNDLLFPILHLLQFIIIHILNIMEFKFSNPTCL